MSTKSETKKEVLINIRVTKEMIDAIRYYDIDVADTCRQALQKAIDRTVSLSKNPTAALRGKV